MITSLQMSSDNRPDRALLPRIAVRYLSAGPDVWVVVADRGYDDSNNHVLLESRGIHNAINLPWIRT